MFTGIVESTSVVKDIEKEGSNLVFTFFSPLSSELKIDQSISHNGVCLTVTEIKDDLYKVTAIDETLQKTNLKNLKIGNTVNIERCMLANGRFDGHIVQGHVDQIAICKNISDENGSWKFKFEYNTKQGNITVNKGSICVNGISLTVVDSYDGAFTVAIIPYTFDNTNFKELKIDDEVNLEFDIIGKYIQKILSNKI